MALAAVFTAVPNTEDVWGRTITGVFDIAITGTYSTAGFSADPTKVGQLSRFKVVTDINQEAGPSIITNLVASLDTTNKVIRFYGTAGGATGLTEIAGAVVITQTIRVRFFGF